MSLQRVEIYFYLNLYFIFTSLCSFIFNNLILLCMADVVGDGGDGGSGYVCNHFLIFNITSHNIQHI